MSLVNYPEFSPPTEPCILKAVALKCTYRLYESHIFLKLFLITSLATAAIGLVTATLLNQLGVFNAFNTATQWSLFGVGVLIGGALLLGFYEYIRAKKYVPNRDFDFNSLDQDCQFLRLLPKWHSTSIIYGEGEYIRDNTDYHNWYTFIEKKDDILEIGPPKIRMMDTTCEPPWPTNIQVHWENKKQKQVIYWEKNSGELIQRYENSVQRPNRVYYPGFQEDTVFIEDGQGNIVKIKLNGEEETPIAEISKICEVKQGERISLIRCSGNILVLGYLSGVVELIDLQTLDRFATFKAAGEVLDCWINVDKQQIEIFSNLSSTCGGGFRRRLMEVWHF